MFNKNGQRIFVWSLLILSIYLSICIYIDLLTLSKVIFNNMCYQENVPCALRKIAFYNNKSSTSIKRTLLL